MPLWTSVDLAPRMAGQPDLDASVDLCGPLVDLAPHMAGQPDLDASGPLWTWLLMWRASAASIRVWASMGLGPHMADQKNLE